MRLAPGDPFQKLLKLSEDIRRLQFRGPVFGHNVDVPQAVNAIPVLSEVFPGEPLDSISMYGLSHAFGDGYAKAVPPARGRGKAGHEKGGVHPPTLPDQTDEFRPLSQPVRLAKRLSAQILVTLIDRFPGPAGPIYPASRFLPLARRRLIILRPCLVDIRFKKPWFRARRSLLG